MAISSASVSDKVEIGRITGAHGIKGEVRVFVHSGSIENLRSGMEVLLENAGKREVHTVEKAGLHGRVVLLRLKGITDRNAAEKLAGSTLFIDESELADLPEDTYYLRDLEGLKVFDDESGREVGILSEVIQGPAQDIYRVRAADGKEALVPAVKEFVKAIDTEGGTVRIRFIDGMF